ncbi:MAG: SDR family NAD(P)-dependent oxidoreductase [Microbacteriaceae bacterium]
MSYPNPPAPIAASGRRLEGKVVFVSGASSGIGEAAARLFAGQGALVAATARRLDRLEKIVDDVRAAGSQAIALGCDVADEASVSAAVAATVSEFGRLDAAFNNSGVAGDHLPLHEITADEFDQLMRINLRGVFICLRQQIPHMLAAGGGSIVVTSSIYGLVGGRGNADYGTSKFGLTGMIRAAALDYWSKGIRVNAVAPGPTWSEMVERRMSTEEGRKIVEALGPIAHPEDVARAALFLLSDDARWTTGWVLPVDGGISIR